jgi:hypothetical protein
MQPISLRFLTWQPPSACLSNPFMSTIRNVFDDKDWSKQQNVIINSSLKSANMTREQFFKIKKETNYVKY